MRKYSRREEKVFKGFTVCDASLGFLWNSYQTTVKESRLPEMKTQVVERYLRKVVSVILTDKGKIKYKILYNQSEYDFLI